MGKEGRGSREQIKKEGKLLFYMVFLWRLGEITFNSSMLSLGMTFDLSLCFKVSSNNLALSE